MEYRKARESDFDKIVDLQNQNSITKLTDEEKKDGFLSSTFSAQEISKFNDNLAVIVAEELGDLAAFLVTSTPEANLAHPLPAAMIARYPNITHLGKALSTYKSIVAGPVCIAKNFRGKGLLKGLYDSFANILDPQYDLAVALVSTTNPRSLKAHESLGMERVDNFEFNGREFYTLALLI